MAARKIGNPEYLALTEEGAQYPARLRIQHLAYGARRYWGWTVEKFDGGPYGRGWVFSQGSGEDTREQAIAIGRESYAIRQARR